MPHEFEFRLLGAPADPVRTEPADRHRGEEVRIDVLRRCGRWEQSRETFERLGYLSEAERIHMWELTAYFKRLHAELVDPRWLDAVVLNGTTGLFLLHETESRSELPR